MNIEHEITGDFEIDYYDGCRRASIEPFFQIKKFRSTLPLLPIPNLGSDKYDSAIVNVLPIDNDDLSLESAKEPDTVESDIAINLGSIRNVINETREASMQEFLKRSQLYGVKSVRNIIMTEAPLPSYIFKPTISLEFSGEDCENDSLNKISIRGYKVDLA